MHLKSFKFAFCGILSLINTWINSMPIYLLPFLSRLVFADTVSSKKILFINWFLVIILCKKLKKVSTTREKRAKKAFLSPFSCFFWQVHMNFINVSQTLTFVASFEEKIIFPSGWLPEIFDIEISIFFIFSNFQMWFSEEASTCTWIFHHFYDNYSMLIWFLEEYLCASAGFLRYFAPKIGKKWKICVFKPWYLVKRSLKFVFVDFFCHNLTLLSSYNRNNHMNAINYQNICS